MLIKKDKACLIAIDLQDKLTSLVVDSDRLIKHCQWLLELASFIKLPCFATEHYPQGLGPFNQSLSDLIPNDPFPKVSFSALGDLEIKHYIQSLSAEQFILIGIESHVCVLQTAFDLLNASKEVYIVTDCISSRCEEDKQQAIERMKQSGIYCVTREMVLFECLGQAGTDLFRQVSQRFLQ